MWLLKLAVMQATKSKLDVPVL